MVEAMSQLTDFVFESYTIIFILAGFFQFLLARSESNIGILFPVILGVIILIIIAFMVAARVRGLEIGDLSEFVVRVAKLFLIIVVLTLEYAFVRAFFY
jgi:hypothetical protein